MNMQTEEGFPHESVDLGDLAHSVGFLLRIAQVQIFAAYFRRFGKYDIKPAELSVLWLLHRNPGVRQGEIARSLSIKPAHMTKLIQRLALLELVERHVPESDRRVVDLRLSAKGAEFVRAQEEDFIHLHLREKNDLTGAELADLTHLLRRFIGLEAVS